MASITITIPDAVVSRVLDAFATFYNHNPAVDGTKAAFAKAQIGKYAKGIVKDVEGRAADAASRASVETDIAIT